MQVFRAYDIETGTEVALKIHCLDNKVPQGGGQKEYVRRAIREVNIPEPLRHQCIVRLHHVFEITDTSFAIVMEACKGTSVPFSCLFFIHQRYTVLALNFEELYLLQRYLDTQQLHLQHPTITPNCFNI